MSRLLISLFLLMTLTGIMGDEVMGDDVPSSAPEAGLVAGIEGVPLMNGLVEIDDLTIVFDKPEGRIVSAVAEGSVVYGAVQAFYESELPSYGWVQVGLEKPMVFRRDEESLEISIEPNLESVGVLPKESLPVVRVSFRLSPR